MSSEAITQRANAINELSSLITKLDNLFSAIKEFDHLRLEGAHFYGEDDETFQEYCADMDSICALARGRAGEAISEELVDKEPLEHLCKLGGEETEGDLGPNDLRIIVEAIERAQMKAQVKLNKLLSGED